MCLQCDGPSAGEDCPFERDEHHPDQWPDNATPEDYPLDNQFADWHEPSGKPIDSNGRRYNPYQGSVSQTEGRCSAVLTNWDDRYGEPRYCMGLPAKKFPGSDSDFCHNHKHRETNEALMERARDAFTHGLFSKSIKHVFDKLPPWQQLSALGRYDAYIAESQYSFDAELQDHTIDFSDFDGTLPIEIAAECDDEEVTVGVPIPSEYENRAYALYRVAISDVKSGLAERSILDSTDAGAMETERVIDVDPETGRQVTDIEEHHLNLSLSRLDKDRKELLSFGGVTVDADDDGVNLNVDSPDELVLDLDDGSDAATDEPNPIEQDMLDADDN
jgi:hypothetical protein